MEELFWSKVDKAGADECWIWSGPRGTREYGIFCFGGKRMRAHRVAWELANGKPFPEGMDGCHSCDNPPCVNPAHIWPGTASDNARDAFKKGRLYIANLGLTHCPKGHAYSGTNVRFYTTSKGYRGRSCKLCNAIRCKRQRDEKKRQAALTPAGKGRTMIVRIHIVCDRCHQEVKDAAKDCNGTTGGYYEVERGPWWKFANPGEKYLCDACMFADARYISAYGKVQP